MLTAMLTSPRAGVMFSALLLLAAFGLVAKSAGATELTAGGIPGQFAISDGGAATYRVPLMVPPGVGGLSPKVALAYDSQAGNGLLGQGWSLEGLSAIQRCPQIPAVDGVRGSVNFDANDRFCLDGQRLILVAGSYGSPGSEYRTEIDGFSRVVAYGSAGGGPQSFTVQTKAGLTLQFGSTTDARLEAQSGATVRSWSVNRVADAVNNAMTISYGKDVANGIVYPARIDYAGGSVRFVYSPRSDGSTGYFAGNRTVVTQRLSEVGTFVGEVPQHVYRMSYLPADDGHSPSRLGQIDLIHLPTDTAVQSTKMTWSAASTGFSGANWPGHSGGIANNFVGDFNGDGRSDLAAYAGTGNWHVVLSSGNDFSGAMWAGHSGGAENNFVGDFNGDGLADMAAYVANGQWQVCLSNGGGFSCSVWSGHSGGAQNNVLGDFDGDGRTDMAGYTGSNGVWHVCLSNGGGFNCSYWENGHTGGASNNIVADFNGDGRADLASYAGEGKWHVVLSTGSGFSGSYWTGHSGGSANNFVGDFNGDGLSDMAAYIPDASGQWHVCLSTGVGFSCSVWSGHSGGPQNNIVGDFDGDGRTDMAGYTGSNGAWDVCLSKGNGFSCAMWTNGHSGGATNNVVGDFNGDGQQDLGAYVGGGIWQITLSAAARNSMTALVEGSGRVLSVAETSLSSAGSGYVLPAGGYPTVGVQRPLYVVRRVVRSNGVGGTLAETHDYAGLRTEAAMGRGALGFEEVKVTDLQTGLVTVTRLSQNWPFTGWPLVTESRTGSGQVLSRTENVLQVSPGSAGATVFPFVAQSVQSGSDLNGALLPTATTRYEYGQSPQYGAPTAVDTVIADEAGKRAVNEYWPANVSDGKWILGRLKKTTVTSSQGAVSSPGSTGAVVPTPTPVPPSGGPSGHYFNLLGPAYLLLLN